MTLTLNALWTPLFFGLHRPGLAFAEIIVLDLAVLATLIAYRPLPDALFSLTPQSPTEYALILAPWLRWRFPLSYAPMTPTLARPPRLRLGDYYLLEGLNSASASLFLLAIYFWTHARLGFGEADNLLLGSVQGLTYIVFSVIGGRMAERRGYDRLFAYALVLAALALSLLLLCPTVRVAYGVIALYTVAIAGTWPALEAAIVHVAGRFSTAQRIAFYNVVWSIAGTAGIFLSGAIFRWRAGSVIVLPLLGHLLQLACIAFWRSRGAVAAAAGPAAGAPPPAAAHARRSPRFLKVAWLGNMLGYLVVSSVSALAPHIGQQLGLDERVSIWLVCSMFLARGITFAGLGVWEGWHYRWSLLVGSILLIPVGLAVVFFGRTAPVALLAFVAMGWMLGLVYSSSLFYSMDIGVNKGENGGSHEAILGGGLFLGPLVGVFGARWLPALAGMPDWRGALGAKLAILGFYGLVAGGGLLVLSRCRRPAAAAA